tara:strand:+ start:305 stop:502 length:198 start_codon:yes stop_codon:yes gene_type:complete
MATLESNNTQKVTYRLNKKGKMIAVPIITSDEFLKKLRKNKKPMSIMDAASEARRKKRTLLNKNK